MVLCVFPFPSKTLQLKFDPILSSALENLWLMFCLSICILYSRTSCLPACLPATSRIPDTNTFYIILSAFNCSTRPKFSGSCHDSYLPNINPLSTLTPVTIFESEKEFVLCFVLMAFLSYCIVHSWIIPRWVITMYKANLTFVFPSIVSVITIDNQQDATILIYFTSNQLYMFRAMFLPIIRSISL